MTDFSGVSRAVDFYRDSLSMSHTLWRVREALGAGRTYAVLRRIIDGLVKYRPRFERAYGGVPGLNDLTYFMAVLQKETPPEAQDVLGEIMAELNVASERVVAIVEALDRP